MNRRLARNLEWLHSHINLEANKGISAGKIDGLSTATIEGLLALLGSPQLDVPAVHLTGTNGKGSTAMLTSRILHAHGLSVGTYGSPHIHALNERIQHNGEPITDDDFADLLDDVRAAADHFDGSPTWFELMTAAAYRWFGDVAVQAGVIEVGMLGRFDATKVADTRVAVVTNVAKDHTDGSEGWAERVAWEKAGIIMPESTLVLGELDPALQEIFLAEPAAKQLVRNRDFGTLNHSLAVGGRVLDVRTPRGQYEDVFLSMHGSFQVDNASLAMVVAEEFLDSALDPEALNEAFSGANMPARLEVVGVDPLVIIDGAHNPAGAEAASATVRDDFQVFGERFLLVGMMEEKDPVEMLTALDADQAELVVCCQPNWARGMSAEDLGAAARSMGLSVEVIASPVEGYERLRMLATDSDLIFVGGSLYVAADVRAVALDGDAADGDDHRSDDADEDDEDEDGPDDDFDSFNEASLN